MKYGLIFLCFVVYPWVAEAQTFYGAGLSAQTSGRAGIFTTSAENAADALSLNPAGLSALTAPVVDLSVTGILARGSFSNAANPSSAMRPNNGFVPFGAFGTPIGHSRWTVAAGFSPDLLSSSKWDYNDAPGYGGVTYGAQREKSAILAFRTSAGVAYKVSPMLSLGATFGVIYNSNTLDAPYIFQSHPVLAGLKTLLNLHTTGTGYNYTVGMIAKPSKRLEVGASYRGATPITSHGTATGSLYAAFDTLGIPLQPAFGYRAQVHIELPATAMLSLSWKATAATRLNVQGEWTGWRGSFNNLPVTLTQGNNADINSLLASNGIKDVIPLDWKDQFTFRGSVEHEIGESFTISGGFLHGTNPVPNSTLSPLTAAIMQNGISAGAGYRVGRVSFHLSYGFDFMAQQTVGSSLLLYDEYSNARTRVGTQSVTLSTTFRPF
jgi:long-subunit fatty acid transport protein